MPAFLIAWGAGALRWGGTPKNWPYIGAGLVILTIIFLVVMVRHDGAVIQRQGVQVVGAKAAATVAKGDAQAATDAAGVVSKGADRDAAIQATGAAHARVLQTTPGHDAPVARSVNDAARRGLCDYAAYANDPTCVQLRKPRP